MKRLFFLGFTALFLLPSCQQKKEAVSNPFLTEYNTPFGVPPFDKITNNDYIPAFEEAMKQHSDEIAAIVNNPEAPTFENTIEAMAYSGHLLGKVASVFYGLNSASTNDEMQQIAEEISPKLSAHFDEIGLNPELFKRVKAVYDQKADLNLDETQNYILENVYKGFVLDGANLPADKKEQLKEINQKLSLLTLKFEQNVLAETNNFKLVIDNEADLAGLPPSVIQAAAQTAKEDSLEGKWVFTTQKPSMLPFLTYAKNRDLRKELYMGYTTRGNQDDQYDNKQILSDILKLRVEKAHLLGFDNYAGYRLSDRMAKKPENVMNLLNKLWDAALPVSKQEAKDMQQMINDEGGNFKLASWDWWYYAEKVRKAKYDLDDNELRPYFELNNVREGAFSVANKLYGITFTEIKDIPKPHPDAMAFDVKEADGSHLGVLYMDFYPRASKEVGAWCGDYREYYVQQDGKKVTPVVTVVTNFTKPSGDKPALLSMDEVETLFHEFGHSLDGLFAKNHYPETFVARDFVELPSQIMEHWATEPQVLNMYAKHYETGEPIPDELIEKMKKSTYFNQGFDNVEYLAASMLDMEYHMQNEPKDLDINKFEKDYLDGIGLIPEILPRYRSTYFKHIMGGYDAGYYSYIWAAVLDNDAYEAFREKGIFDQATATSFRKNILELNGVKDPMELFVNFRGREPEITPLLKNRGLLRD